MAIEDTYSPRSPRKTNQRLFDPFREIPRPLLLYSLQLCEARINVYYKIRCSTRCTGLVNRSTTFQQNGALAVSSPSSLQNPLVNSNFLLFSLQRVFFPRIEPKRSFVCLLVDVGCRNRKRGEKPKFVKFLFFHSSVYRASRGCPDEIFKLPNYFHTGSLFPLIVRFMRKIKFFPGRETRQEFVSALQSSPNLRD